MACTPAEDLKGITVAVRVRSVGFWSRAAATPMERALTYISPVSLLAIAPDPPLRSGSGSTSVFCTLVSHKQHCSQLSDYPAACLNYAPDPSVNLRLDPCA